MPPGNVPRMFPHAHNPAFVINYLGQAVRCWADETLRWELDSHFELAVRKPTKLISLPLMRLVVGLEERGNFVRYNEFPLTVLDTAHLEHKKQASVLN